MHLFAIVISLLSLLSFPEVALAIYDPVSVSNNKVGIHILFPDEIHQASQLVNRQDEASWGYVTIPIQSGDRSRTKWQKFMDDCRTNKVIPIIRLATAPNGSNWEEPTTADLIDFANFLSDLNWPTQNRYVIIFNEVNRPDEYGGRVSPENYAKVLSLAVEVFKSRSSDFFILPAGLDNAAISRGGAIYWRTFLIRMEKSHPGIFNIIDGWNSHAYPNPDFSSRPDLSGENKIDSYRYDLNLIRKFSDKKLPVFITETGWSNKYLSDRQVSIYYQYAFDRIWSDPSVIAITPFLLNAQDGPFTQFSFLNSNQLSKDFASTISQQATAGNPPIPTPEPKPNQFAGVTESTPNQEVLGATIYSDDLLKNLYNSFQTILNQLNQ